MTLPETETLQADIRIKRQELQRELEIGQESLLAKREELLAPLTQEIETLLQQIGASEGYSLILEKRLVTLLCRSKVRFDREGRSVTERGIRKREIEGRRIGESP